MTRSLKKGPFVRNHILKKIHLIDKSQEPRPIKTWSRSSIIVPIMVGQTIAIYNGREHLPLFITEQIVGHKLGEFSPTRTFRGHTKLDKNKKTKRLCFFFFSYGTKNSSNWHPFGN